MSKSSKKHPQQKKQTSSPNLKIWFGLVLAILVVGVGILIFTRANANQSITFSNTATSYLLEISASDVAANRAAGAFILDVRTQAEWDSGHISGATLIPLDTLANRLNEVPRDKAIIVVCRSGGRSAQGRDLLRKAGFTHVTSLSGGLTNWIAQGYPTVSGAA